MSVPEAGCRAALPLELAAAAPRWLPADAACLPRPAPPAGAACAGNSAKCKLCNMDPGGRGFYPKANQGCQGCKDINCNNCGNG